MFIPLSFLAGRQLQPESAERAERQVRHPDAPLALAVAAEAGGAARVPSARDQEGAEDQRGRREPAQGRQRQEVGLRRQLHRQEVQLEADRAADGAPGAGLADPGVLAKDAQHEFIR